MPKIYDPKPESEELYLRLTGGHDSVLLEIVDEHGSTEWSLVEISDRGIELASTIPELKAARAGLTNALDANGRLKVIGQEVEAEPDQPEPIKAQELTYATYECANNRCNELRTDSTDDGRVEIWPVRQISGAHIYLDRAAICRLRDNLTAHLAYLEQERLDKP